MENFLITTKNLIIRRFKSYDLDDIHVYLSKRNAFSFMPWLANESIKSLRAMRLESNEYYAVCIKDNQMAIGEIRLTGEGWGNHSMSIIINKDFCGHGYGFEAVSAFVEYAFNTLNARRIVADCLANDAVSIKILERLRFIKEAIRVDDLYINNTLFSTFSYALLASNWQKALEQNNDVCYTQIELECLRKIFENISQCWEAFTIVQKDENIFIFEKFSNNFSQETGYSLNNVSNTLRDIKRDFEKSVIGGFNKIVEFFDSLKKYFCQKHKELSQDKEKKSTFLVKIYSELCENIDLFLINMKGID